MTSEQILSEFTKYLKSVCVDKTKIQVFKPLQRPPATPHKNRGYTHRFYDISHVGDFIAELSALKSKDEDEEDYLSSRYLVDTTGRLIFAREGKAGRHTPRHKEMGSDCIAAGNAIFNQDYSKVGCINHESGDFSPSMESLVHVLRAILVNAPGMIDEQITLMIRMSPSSNPISVDIKKEDLLKCLIEPWPDEIKPIQEANKPWDSILVKSEQLLYGKQKIAEEEKVSVIVNSKPSELVNPNTKRNFTFFSSFLQKVDKNTLLLPTNSANRHQ